MKIDFEYNNEAESSFQELTRKYSPSEFASPYRSTIPMLSFWHDPELVLAEINRAIGIDLPHQITLSFEYCVGVQKGKGQPSQTDLMLISDQYAVAIEAKYTEPPYAKVEAWLGESDNKRNVLGGWLDLINAKAKNSVGINDILDLPYQMIHRLASACFLDKPENILVYQCFDLDQRKIDYYRTNLGRMTNLFKMPGNVKTFLINQPLQKSPEYQQLQRRWDDGERQMSVDVLDGMKKADFIRFSEPEIFRIV